MTLRSTRPLSDHPALAFSFPVQASGVGVITFFRTIFTQEETPTYWNWTVQRLHAPDGQTLHLLQAITDVTTHVLARQRAEHLQLHLTQTTQVVEAERRRLAVIDTVAESVRASLDVEVVGQATLQAIQAAFQPSAVYLHTADVGQHVLRLLQISTPAGGEAIRHHLQEVSFESPFFLARACRGQDPLIIEDLPAALSRGLSLQLPALAPLIAALHVQSYVCVPLWCNEHWREL